MITITKTITQPEEVINTFADRLGYQSQIPNPDYVAAELDPVTFKEITPAVGEPTLSNPQTRLEYVSERFDDFVADKFFGQFAERDAIRQKMEEAKAVKTATVEAIKATIVTS